MNKALLGAFIALVLAGIGMAWLHGQGVVERGAPPPEPPAERPTGLPSADVSGMRGPPPPQASELSREAQRFYRYDRDRDNRITRNEMLSSRTAAFRKLDKDGNNLLTFEEWAVATVDRFESADKNRDGWLSKLEFATTAPPPPKPSPTPKCTC